jgi:uncharacterized protein YciI
MISEVNWISFSGRFARNFFAFAKIFQKTIANTLASKLPFRHTDFMRTRRFCYTLLLIWALLQPIWGSEELAKKTNQFIYVLRPVPRLYDDKNWTNDDNAALQRHFVRFKHAIDTGELILAGRTRESGDKTFGIAIFQAPDEAAARKFMESDPAVVAGLMTAELHPFSVALERRNP